MATRDIKQNGQVVGTVYTPSSDTNELDEILLRAYYRGKDGKGYSDFELRQDKRQLEQLIASKEAEAEKRGFQIGYKAAGGDIIPLEYTPPLKGDI